MQHFRFGWVMAAAQMLGGARPRHLPCSVRILHLAKGNRRSCSVQIRSHPSLGNACWVSTLTIYLTFFEMIKSSTWDSAYHQVSSSTFHRWRQLILVLNSSPQLHCCRTVSTILLRDCDRQWLPCCGFISPSVCKTTKLLKPSHSTKCCITWCR